MPFDTLETSLDVLETAVFRPGQLDQPLHAQVASEAVRFGYKEVTKGTGIKGLRYKDEATLMAVMAVHRIVAKLGDEAQDVKDRTAIIVSSNFGNVDTVVEVARQIHETHVDDTSAMALPNASSNSVSATLSILFQFRGINLMLCNGDNGGEDGVSLAEQLIASGRADRVLLVGVEVDNETVRSLFPTDRARFHGAAAVMLGSKSQGLSRGEGSRVQHLDPEDVEARCGLASGAEGVLRLVLASEMARSGSTVETLVSGKFWAFHP